MGSKVSKIISVKTSAKKESVKPYCSSIKFPSDVIKYINKNADLKVRFKLAQICKYFQHKTKYPYLPVKYIRGYVNHTLFVNYITDGEKTLSLADIPDNLWITKELDLWNQENLASNLIPKIAVCDIKLLELHEISITFKEYKFLTANGNIKKLKLSSTAIKLENGNNAALEDLLKRVKKVKTVYFSSRIPPIISLEDLINLEFSFLKSFTFEKVPETFDLLAFAEFMNVYRYVHFNIYFVSYPLSLEYTQFLQDFVDNTIIKWSTKYPPPQIKFIGQEEDSRKALTGLYFAYCSRYRRYQCRPHSRLLGMV